MSDEQTIETPAPSELELLRAEVRAGFAEVRAGFAEVRAGFAATASAAGVAAEFEGVTAEFNAVRAEIAAEGEKSRRHMDVLVERVESHVKLVAEVNSHHATVLNNHENRLQKIEKRA